MKRIIIIFSLFLALAKLSVAACEYAVLRFQDRQSGLQYFQDKEGSVCVDVSNLEDPCFAQALAEFALSPTYANQTIIVSLPLKYYSYDKIVLNIGFTFFLENNYMKQYKKI